MHSRLYVSRVGVVEPSSRGTKECGSFGISKSRIATATTNDVSRFAFARPFGGWLGCANWWAKRSVGRKCMPYQPRAVNVVWDGQFQWEPRIVWLLFSLRANVISLGWRMLLSSRVLLVGVLKYSSCLNGSHGIIHTLFSQYRYKFVINECGIFIYAWLYRYSLTLNSENSYSISTHSVYA